MILLTKSLMSVLGCVSLIAYVNLYFQLIRILSSNSSIQFTKNELRMSNTVVSFLSYSFTVQISYLKFLFPVG